MKPKLSLKAITRIAILSALSVALSYVRIYQLPQGGNVSLSMVPILLAYVYLDKTSAILTAIISGILQYIPDPYFINLLQWLIDYPLAWGALALPVILPEKLNKTLKIIFGGIIGGIGRFAFHFLSGILFFAMFAPEDVNPAIYYAIYNLSYIIPGVAVTIIILLILDKMGIGKVFRV